MLFLMNRVVLLAMVVPLEVWRLCFFCLRATRMHLLVCAAHHHTTST